MAWIIGQGWLSHWRLGWSESNPTLTTASAMLGPFSELVNITNPCIEVLTGSPGSKKSCTPGLLNAHYPNSPITGKQRVMADHGTLYVFKYTFYGGLESHSFPELFVQRLPNPAFTCQDFFAT